jgi:hypothetical protein
MAKVKNDETDRATETGDVNAEARENGADTSAAVPIGAAVKAASHKSLHNESGIAVYIGPTIHGQIQKGAVFKGGKQEATALYAVAIERYPAIARLIVPAERLAEARNNIRLQRGLVYKHYKELVSKVQGR